ncbi:MAG TPA: MarR family transcriptional regulator [Pseudonocardiaceae bacterium]|nr:MarR family transcriptional regulator [Pseudonocardiaceae bacterium]
MTPEELLGTRLRDVLDTMDGAVAEIYQDLGLAGFRPRYTPILRLLAADGPRSIRDLAAATGVTHSAASQTVAQLAKEGYVVLVQGRDARQRIVHLTEPATAILPVLDVESAATTAAVRELDAELPFPLSDLITAITEALANTPFHDRIATHLKPTRATDRQADQAPARRRSHQASDAAVRGSGGT